MQAVFSFNNYQGFHCDIIFKLMNIFILSSPNHPVMKKILSLTTLFTSAICFSQNQQLRLTDPEKGKFTHIKKGDKVLMAVKLARHDVRKKSSDVYMLSRI